MKTSFKNIFLSLRPPKMPNRLELITKLLCAYLGDGGLPLKY